MEITATFKQKATINPKDVINELIGQSIGYGSWVFEEDGRFYCGWTVSAGSHSFDSSEEIDQEKYAYICNLQFVLRYLERKGY